MQMETQYQIEVESLEMRYGDHVIIQDINFKVKQGEIFVVMGGSGSGKSTLLKYLIGLKEAEKGQIYYQGKSFVDANQDERYAILQKIGILYQGGALWSSMTVGENIALVLHEYTTLKPKEIEELVSIKLALVGLKGCENYYPAELSGGMRKRAGLARAIALDPEILYFDEPSSGLDPVNSKHLDDLILELKESLNATILIVTHELASIFRIADYAIYLDPVRKIIGAEGKPRELLHASTNKELKEFLTRGGSLAL